MKNFWKYIFPGVFGLLIYTSIRIVTDTMTKEPFWERSVRQNLIEIIFTLALGYLMHYLLHYFIMQFNKRKESFSLQQVLLEFSIITIVCIATINPAVFLIHYLAGIPNEIADMAIANILVVLYALLYYSIVRGNNLVRSYIDQKTQIERLRSEGLQTELKFLKAQYHPHFLFNALNTIYFQMDESVCDAKLTVEKFSELLRYQLYDQQQLVPVEQEWQHLQNFIHLQKIRASDKLTLHVHFDEGLKAEKIYPLLLLPFVENAFKYVEGNNDIKIEARKDGNWLHFIVQNAVPMKQNTSREGIGLENLHRRLELLYPGMHYFSAKNTMINFIAELKLQSHQ
jgi:sensor histidine kinase YesM